MKKVVKDWNRLPREKVQTQFMVVFKRHVNMANRHGKDGLASAGLMAGLSDPKAFPNLNDSVIL